jgi:hypothetical protein
VTHVSSLLVHTIYETSTVYHVAELDFDRTVHVARKFDRTVHICWFRVYGLGFMGSGYVRLFRRQGPPTPPLPFLASFFFRKTRCFPGFFIFIERMHRF